MWTIVHETTGRRSGVRTDKITQVGMFWGVKQIAPRSRNFVLQKNFHKGKGAIFAELLRWDLLGFSKESLERHDGQENNRKDLKWIIINQMVVKFRITEYTASVETSKCGDQQLFKFNLDGSVYST